MMSSFLTRYRAGESIQVWRELLALGAQVRETDFAEDGYRVALETMRRVRQNVETVHHRLIQLGYQFWVPERAVALPSPSVSGSLAEVEHLLGPLPLSLRAFYEVVGSVDFRQSPQQLIQWQEPGRTNAPELRVLGEEDPLVIKPLADLHGAMQHSGTRLSFCFAPDEFFKANYGGGENYHVWLPNPAADFRIEGMYYIDEYFVDYLRASFVGGGFRGRIETLPDNDQQCHKVAPQLQIIQTLAADLLPI
ncbi:MAG TPA: hypothetical protein VGF38_10070 [Ktedonobacterales bacterium]|jgi:hypothetical protein